MFWQSVMNSTNPADFEAYLRRFPNGVFSDLAQNRLAAIRGPAGSRPADAGAVGIGAPAAVAIHNETDTTSHDPA